VDWSKILIGDAAGLIRLLVIGAAAYVALVAILRITGKRTLSKMNAFDLIVTVALGSTLATVILSRSVSLVQGIAAFLLLTLLQFAVTWTSVRSARFQRWIKAEPRLLAHDGRLLESAMRQERVTRKEIEAAVREKGLGALQDAKCVVLETDGSLSIVEQRQP
jgi:uncharacterized membrane protein YcaP (DUF421 family)